MNNFMHDFIMKVLRSDFEKGLDIGYVGELAVKYLGKGYLTEEDIIEINSWYEEKAILEEVEEPTEVIEEETEENTEETEEVSE